jgi:hypothetical protein
MKFSFASLFTKLTLATSVAGALVGCDEPKYPEPTPIATPSTAQARYQVVNAAPGAGDARLVSIDNVAPATPFAAVPYLGVASYANIPAGQRLLLFSTASNLNNQQIALRSNFSTNSNTTVFLTDIPTRAASGTDQGGVRTVVLADNLAAPAAGRSRVRFINLSPSLTASGANGFGLFIAPTSTSGTPNTFLFPATGRGYRATSYTVPNSNPAQTTNFANFTDIAAGTYTVSVRASTTATDDVAPQPLTFVSGKIYTVYVRGSRVSSLNAPLGISTILHN